MPQKLCGKNVFWLQKMAFTAFEKYLYKPVVVSNQVAAVCHWARMTGLLMR